MKIQFTKDTHLQCYRGPDANFEDGQVKDVPERVAKYLLTTFPNNFGPPKPPPATPPPAKKEEEEKGEDEKGKGDATEDKGKKKADGDKKK